MDCFPAYTWFDTTQKVVCDITIVGGATASDESVAHANGDESPLTDTTSKG